jgi:hypothetical protein
MKNFIYWKKQEQKFIRLTKTAVFPSSNLKKVDFVDIKNITDFDKIPQEAGCYWIWTNEKIIHTFHKDKIPEGITNRIEGKRIRGEIIYNGVGQGISGRIKNHLLGKIKAGWSGVSIDIYFGRVKSHKKKAMSKKGKVPFVNLKISSANKSLIPIMTKELLLKLNLSRKEKRYIKTTNKNTVYFRNGINIFEPKHKKYKFRVYYIAEINPLYISFIEKKWREKYGRPKLCYYKEGR